MHDESEVLNLRRPTALDARLGAAAGKAADAEQASCPAYTYLRGNLERALAVEFRLKTGDREFFPYSLLGPWRYDPSVGLLLKFTGDLVSLVLIHGSNLDALVNDTVNLTDRGFQRHRIVAVREMDEGELRLAGPGRPTVDRIDIAEFESQAELRVWLAASAPAFLRK